MLQSDVAARAPHASYVCEIPLAAYVEPAVCQHELRALFGTHWLPVGRAEEISEHGAFFTWERTHVPLVMMRAADGQVRAFYNSCRHRGAPVDRTPSGRARAFRCQYHSWTYDTFGKLMAIPDERDFGDIDRCAYSLIPLQIVEDAGWLWIRQVAEGPSLSESFGAAYAAFAAASQAVRFEDRSVVTVTTNWKAAVERIADLLAGTIAPGGSISGQLPNRFFVQSEGELSLIAAWPRDERTTDVEIVRCVGEGVLVDDAWRSRGSALQARLRSELDDIPLSAVSGQASREMHARLAAEWRRCLDADSPAEPAAGGSSDS